MPLTKLCRRILLGLVTRWRRPCQRELATQLASVPRNPSLSLSNASVEHYTQKRSLTSLEHSHIHIAYYSFGLGWVSDAMLPAPAFSARCIASISAHNCRWFARTVRPQTTTATTKQKRKQPVKPERLETAHAQGEREHRSQSGSVCHALLRRGSGADSAQPSGKPWTVLLSGAQYDAFTSCENVLFC
jgi:hypothetical protein